MTLEELRQYKACAAERQRIIKKAEKGKATDGERLRLRVLDRQSLKMLRFIKGCPDPFIRQIMTYRFIEGLSWDMVAARMGGGNSADSCRKLAVRYINRNGREKIKRSNTKAAP